MKREKRRKEGITLCRAKNNFMFSYAEFKCLTQQVVGLCCMLLCDEARLLLDSKTSWSLRSHLVGAISLYIACVI